MIHTELRIPPYQVLFIIGLTSNPTDYNNFLKSKSQSVDSQVLLDDDDDIFARTVYGSQDKGDYQIRTIYLFLNPTHPTSNLTAGTITHEVIHIKNMIYRFIGDDPSIFNDEPEAYLTGWLTDTIVSYLNKNNIQLSLKPHKYE